MYGGNVDMYSEPHYTVVCDIRMMEDVESEVKILMENSCIKLKIVRFAIIIGSLFPSKEAKSRP